MSPPAGAEREARLARFSLDRRITVLVLLVTALVVGAVATLGIPVELVPKGYDDPFLRVVIPWRDAPAREVLDKITVPLEEELSTVKGLGGVTSLSTTGRSRVFLRFKQNTDMDLAYREVRDRVERARRQFPGDVDRIYILKDDISGIPATAMGIAVDPEVVDVYNLIQQRIVKPLERVDGVASVEVNGLEEKEVLIELDRDRASASGLNIYELAQQLGGDSFTMASGNVREGPRKLLLRSVARYTDLEELENRLVAPAVRLKDVATITYDEPDKRYRVRAMSRPAYMVVVFKEGEVNAREVSGRVEKVIDELQADPRLNQVEMIVFFDQGEMIDESLHTLIQSGMIGASIAALVLFFFLRRFRLTMVVNLAVPLSLLIALTVMFFAGETLNILSLLALMVSVGLLVDNSVVVAENIDRLHKLGETRRRSAIGGAGEIALAITMSTLTTVIVFLPMALVEGPARFFLLRMAIPICVALIASLLVALVYIPLGVHLTLPRRRDGDRAPRSALYRALVGGLRRAYDRSFGWLNHGYNGLLAVFLRRRLDMVLILVAVFGLTMGMVQKEIRFVDVQESERGGIAFDIDLPDSYTLEETEAWFLESEKIVEAHAEEFGLEGWFSFHRKNFGEIQAWFTTPRSSDLTPREVTERMLELLPIRPGMEISTGEENQADDDRGEGLFRLVLEGEDPTQLGQVAERLEELLLQVDGVLGIRRDSERVPNELGLVVDRERAQHYGVNPQVVAGVVGYALRGQNLPKYHDEGKEIPVRVRFREEDRQSLSALASFEVPTPDGGWLPLSAVTDVRMLQAPERIIRRDKRISRTVSLDLEEGREKETRERLTAVAALLELPEGVSFDTQAQRRDLDDDLAELRFALVLSVIFIYLLMGLLFESFVLPLSIILTIPLASLGVFWIHILSGLDIDFLGAVGIVLLVGVVVNNGIVLIDTVNRLRAEGMGRREAILAAADRRFRPIMMTAITTVGGMVPLALSGRMDSGLSYTSFSYTLIGGMSTATLLTLLVVPVFYTFFDDLREAFGAMLRRILRRRVIAEA